MSWLCTICGDTVPSTISEKDHRLSLSHLLSIPKKSSSSSTSSSSTSLLSSSLKLSKPLSTTSSSVASIPIANESSLSLTKGKKILEKLGWKENTGLGKYEQGIQEPIIPSSLRNNYKGIGTSSNKKINNRITNTTNSSSSSSSDTKAAKSDLSDTNPTKPLINNEYQQELQQQQQQKRRLYQLEFNSNLASEYQDILLTTINTTLSKEELKYKRRKRR